MKCIDVSKVIEVNSAENADKHISIGWKLLMAYTTTYDTVGPLIADQTPHFVLGWPSKSGEPKFPVVEKRWNLETTEL